MQTLRLDHGGMRKTNRGLVLDLLRRNSTIPRAEISRILSLSKATVSDIVAELIDEYIVQEVGEGSARGKGGRKPILLTLNKSTRFVIALNTGNRKIRAAIADLQGSIIYEGEDQEVDYASEQTFVKQAKRLVLEVMDGSGKGKDQILAVGLGVPGTIEKEKGMIQHSFAFGFEEFPLAERVERAVGIPTVIDNCSRVMALGEWWYGNGIGFGNMFFVNAGYGIGSAMVVDGKIYGRHSEFGHIYITSQKVRCNCGNFGCLEAVASAAAIEKEARAKLNLPEGEGLSLPMMIEMAEGGNETVRRVFYNAGKYIGRASSFISNSFNPEQIVIGGELSVAGDLILDPIRDEFFRHIRSDIAGSAKIVLSSLGLEGGLQGAVALALNELVLH